MDNNTVVCLQRQTKVTAYFSSKQLLLFAFVKANNSNCLLEKYVVVLCLSLQDIVAMNSGNMHVFLTVSMGPRQRSVVPVLPRRCGNAHVTTTSHNRSDPHYGYSFSYRQSKHFAATRSNGTEETPRVTPCVFGQFSLPEVPMQDQVTHACVIVAVCDVTSSARNVFKYRQMNVLHCVINIHCCGSGSLF